VDTDRILDYFKDPKRFKYQRFVEDGIIKDVLSLLEDKCTKIEA